MGLHVVNVCETDETKREGKWRRWRDFAAGVSGPVDFPKVLPGFCRPLYKHACIILSPRVFLPLQMDIRFRLFLPLIWTETTGSVFKSVFLGGRCFYVDVLCRYAISPSTELSTLDKPITLPKNKKGHMPTKDENHFVGVKLERLGSGIGPLRRT